jgi:aromatic-L-amino-acid decarboxylase
MGWVHGGGTAVGMLAEMLAAGLNANLGGRDHIPIEVERQIVEWMRQIFGFPNGASGIFVTGTSMANLMAVLVARTTALGRIRPAPRRRRRRRVADGLYLHCGAWLHQQGNGHRGLRQRCVALYRGRSISSHRGRCVARPDRARPQCGRKPFLVVGSAGTVDIGAIDDLHALSSLCREEGLWFHVDGAFGALGMLAPRSRRGWPGSRTPIRSRSISTNGDRCPTTPGFCWSATATGIATRLPRRPPICAGKHAGLPPTHRGLATSAPICRGASGAQDLVHPEDLRHREAWGVITRSCALARYLEARFWPSRGWS